MKRPTYRKCSVRHVRRASFIDRQTELWRHFFPTKAQRNIPTGVTPPGRVFLNPGNGAVPSVGAGLPTEQTDRGVHPVGSDNSPRRAPRSPPRS